MSQQHFLKDSVMLSLLHIFSEKCDNPKLWRYLCMDNKGRFKFAIPNYKSFDFGVQSQYLKKWFHLVAVFDDRNCKLFLDKRFSQHFHTNMRTIPMIFFILRYLPGGSNKNGCDCWTNFIQLDDKKLDQDQVSFLSTCIQIGDG